MIETEQRLHRAAERIDLDERHAVSSVHREAALARAAQCGLVLSGEQTEALDHITDGRGLGVIVGFAGTGKSAMLGVARQAWAVAGYEVRGAALSGIAAENLESGSGISSRTIASMEHGWGQGRDLLTARDVLMINEAGMVGTRQLERVLSRAADVGYRTTKLRSTAGSLAQAMSSRPSNPVTAGCCIRPMSQPWSPPWQVGGPPVALTPLADKTEALKCHTREIYGFDLHR